MCERAVSAKEVLLATRLVDPDQFESFLREIGLAPLAQSGSEEICEALGLVADRDSPRLDDEPDHQHPDDGAAKLEYVDVVDDVEIDQKELVLAKHFEKGHRGIRGHAGPHCHPDKIGKWKETDTRKINRGPPYCLVDRR